VRTDGRTDMTKIIVAFCSFATAPEMELREVKYNPINYKSFTLCFVDRASWDLMNQQQLDTLFLVFLLFFFFLYLYGPYRCVITKFGRSAIQHNTSIYYHKHTVWATCFGYSN
jgi:hypothetical protein